MVIMTIIALLVLMVTIFFIVKHIQNSNDATGCVNNGGECKPTGAPCPDNKPIGSPFSCPKNEKCCTNIGGISSDE
jgi:hypothetical protein